MDASAIGRRFLSGSLLAIAVGALVGLLFSIGSTQSPLFVVLHGVVVGLGIFVSIMLLELLLGSTIDRAPERLRALLHGILFATGGVAGWIVALAIISPLRGRPFDLRELFGESSFVTFIAVSALIAVAVGLASRGYEHLQERLRSANDRLREREWAEKELALARDIQKRLLPPESIDGDGFNIAARNLPAHVVAGDFYDVVRLDDGSIVVVVADVAGKGMVASLIMASVKSVLPFVARLDVAEAMTTLNRKLVKELGRREFVALAYARFFADGTLQLANAGFPDPYLMSDSGQRALTVGGMRLPLGVRESAQYEVLVAKLGHGERVLFVSDGIPEAPAAGEPLGYERLAAIVGETCAGGERRDAWLDSLLQRVRAVVDDGLDDDWTAVVFERA